MKYKTFNFIIDYLLLSLLLISHFYDYKIDNNSVLSISKISKYSYFVNSLIQEKKYFLSISQKIKKQLYNNPKNTGNSLFFLSENSYLLTNRELQFSIDISIYQQAPLVATINNNMVASNSNSTETKTTNNKLPLILSSGAILLGLINLGLTLNNYLILHKFINYQKKNRNHIKNNSQQIQNLENKIQNYNQQIEVFNRNLYDLENSVHTQSSRLRQLEFPSQENQHNPNKESKKVSHNFHSSSQNTLESLQASSRLPENIRLAQSYQDNPASLLKNAIQVGMTKETTNQILGGVWEKIYLEENRRTGEYFIVTNNSGEMYLFLNPNSMFNPQTLSTINKSQLFICHGNFSQSRKGVDINIKQPARVKKEAQYWALVDSGEIVLE